MGRVEPVLTVGHREDVAVLGSDGGAQDAGLPGQPVGESEGAADIVRVGAHGQFAAPGDISGTRERLVAESKMEG